MNCPNCGTSNLDNASICVNCGRSLNAPPPPPPSIPRPAVPVQGGFAPPPPPPRAAYGAAAPHMGEPVPNYLVQSILVTLCCCLPLGIVAIIFSAQVNSRLAVGDFAGAREASKRAKLICWIAFGLGVLSIVLAFLVNGAAFLAGVQDGFNQ